MITFPAKETNREEAERGSIVKRATQQSLRKGWRPSAAIVLLLHLTLVTAQSLPLGYGIPNEALLVFVSEHCSACQNYLEDSHHSAVYIGRHSTSEYAPYVWDEGDILARTFQVLDAPTVVVIKDGYSLGRFAGYLGSSDLDEVLEYLHPELVDPPPNHHLVGSHVPNPLADYTGLIVFWSEDCEWCQLNSREIMATCMQQAVRIVSLSGKGPSQCKTIENADMFLDSIDIPATPTFLFAHEGTIVWSALGYRADLDLLGLALAQKWRKGSE